MFTNLKQLTEAVSGKSILALTDKTGRIIGYYVADDEELIDNPKKALVFNAIDQAEKNAKLSNKQWDLDRGQKFIVVNLQDAKTITEAVSSKEYPDSSHFDADVDEVMDLLKKAMNIVDKAEWADWMEQTDTNFGTSHGSAEDLNEKLYTAVEEAQNAIKTLYDHMIYVGEN